MDNMEYIEGHFRGDHSDVEKQQFEKKILEDSSFAEEVAFYISANGLIHQQLHEEKKQRFRELYGEQKVIPIKTPVRNLWRYLAAASVIIAVSVLVWFLNGGTTPPQQLADKYIRENFEKKLGVTMGNQDSLQAALTLLNSGKLNEALAIFETLAQKDPENNNAKKYAGIVSLRLKNYDTALRYFTLMEADTVSFSNWGKFYKALTLLERDRSGDKEAAKILLQEVRDNNLEGNKEAVEWLNKF